MLWTSVHDLKAALVSLGLAGQQQDQVRSPGCPYYKEMVTWLAWTCNIKEESPFGRYRIRKESSCIRKGLIGLIVLGEFKGLSIPYIRMTCIHVWDKQESI
jgi:hypothetical protein